MKIPPHLAGLSKREIIRRYQEITQRCQEITQRYQEIIQRYVALEAQLDEQGKLIKELECRLLAYENAHTPPSKSKEKHYPKREKGGKQGAPKGHIGVTRKTPEPTESKKLHLDICPDCHNPLGKPKRIERRVIEEIPDPQPLRIIKFFIPHYNCSYCNKKVIPTDSELPRQGNLGNNLLAEISHLKYADRLPLRKISESLNRRYEGLNLSAASIYNALGRVADRLTPTYNNIKEKVRQSERSHADETGAKLDGKKHWFWVFMTRIAVLFVMSKKRESKIVKDVMGEDYAGVMTVDGYKGYPGIIKKIQRCWAHLLREAKFLAQKHKGQARMLYNSLCELYEKVKEAIKEKPMEVRTKLYEKFIKELDRYVGYTKGHKELTKLARTIENAKEQWFTAILYPRTELTNNKAERELREFVVQRKIFGSFRSKEGIRITEIIMSVLATWKIQGFSTVSMLRATLSS